MHRSSRLLLFALLGVFSACGGSGGGGNPPVEEESHPPAISGLEYRLTSGSVGEGGGLAQVEIAVDFSDPDGDVAQLRVSVAGGSNQVVELSEALTAGRATGSFAFDTTAAGEFPFGVAVTDSGGRVSNALTGTYKVTQDLDRSFGDNGVVISTPQPGNRSEFVIQQDEKIVAAGSFFNGADDDVTVYRFNADGTPDLGFASGGKFSYEGPGGHDRPYGLALQPDGRIVVVGLTQPTKEVPDYGDLLLLRLNTDGSLDNTFGTGGVVTIDLGFEEAGHAVAIQDDGRIVVAGKVSRTDSGLYGVRGLLARFLPSGEMDHSFGLDGAITDSGDTEWFALAVHDDGRIVVAGDRLVFRWSYLYVARMNEDGSPDLTLAQKGWQSWGYGGIRSVAVQADGRIVVGGRRYNPSIPSVASDGAWAVIYRLNGDGFFDQTFGREGECSIGRGANLNSVQIRGDGSIMAAGWLNDNALVAKLTGRGELDSTFSIDGISALSVGQWTTWAGNVVPSGDTNVFVVGGSRSSQYDDAAIFVARLPMP